MTNGCTFTLLLLHANTLKLNTSPGRPNYRVLVIVISAFENHDKRIAIRETWAQTKENIRVLFILSKNQHNISLKNMLENEKSIYNDILEVNVPETYNSLSIKLLEALKHIDNLDFQYLLKCDDDSFVDLTGIVQELNKLPKKKLYWGYFNGIANVKKSGKWKESEWILCDKYLPYALGGGYVISKDLVSYIIKNQNYLSLFISEDVTVGAWLAPLNITRKHDRRFDTEFKSRGCNNKYLITHKQSPGVMRLYWSRIQNTGKMCENEYKKFNSYEYNWTVLPSKCCLRNSILSP
ncbi:beta-1,3-galactosyltransferase 6-like isoform X2 [Daktulosphaira vitifoliae]|uniref:beta-1,3-galactosyltransferase 6-like isoform X2 n=1 Tax=Daktulosphaira vitifoliae TaxID=58002 RepID=UPI0021AABE91|nr:beta-1,3-galactosyltransferase 6-like isoform X2 [Daktulosphaira vitifoliae]